MNNTTRSRLFTVFGEIKSVAEWSRDERCNFDRRTLHTRLVERRLDPEFAITGRLDPVAKAAVAA
jgi:hypothetical protein